MDLEKLLPSAIPILLIIAFSWFLSYLGAKSKKNEPGARAAQDKAAPHQEEENLVEKKILEFFGVAEEVEKAKRSEQSPVQTAGEAAPDGWPTRRQPGGPAAPTAKPIEPKWWGA